MNVWLTIRGIGNQILFHLRSKSKSTSTPHFYTSSGGNAGLACVAACKTLGYPATIVVPHSTKPHMIEKLRVAGASDVIQHGATWFDADSYLREDLIAKDPGGVYLHPFDHPAVRDGNSTLVTECHEQMAEEEMDAIVCSVGGGGLFSGIAQGLQGKSTKIITVETNGAESLYKSVQAGKLVTLDGITSIATSLGAKTVAPAAFEYAVKENVESVVVSDEEACQACVRFAEDERMLVEPACGATLALVYENRLGALVPDFRKDSTVVLVVCGGRAIGLDLIQEWKTAYM
jgi:L-serine/L-threonine ammonia-lyase